MQKRSRPFLIRLFAVLLLSGSFCCFAAIPASAYSTPFEPARQAAPGGVNQPAEVVYSLREGGRFIYQNNPERVFSYNIGKALLIEEDLHGDVYFTSENNNQTGERVLFGLQLRNDSGEEIRVTVRNIGWQSGIDWFGQKEWTDFFQVAYELEPEKDNYSFSRVFQPVAFEETTYVLPDGEYFYVAGGSAEDAYGHYNVGGTADVYIEKGKLINSAVYFTIDGPEKGVSAAYVCYRSGKTPVTSREQQGYVVDKNGESFGRQYLGSAPYLCAEASMAWNIDDGFASGKNLPVRYTVRYAVNTAGAGVYGAYTDFRTRTVSSDVWKTHLNPISDNSFIGTDMMPFECATESGERVVVDILHNDGTGKPANIGNWMVVYEESLTVQNSGTKLRKCSIGMSNNGITAMNVKDANGGLIRAVYHHNKNEFFTFYVRPGETRTILLEYVLLADSYGNQTHHVKVEDVSESEVNELLGPAEGDVNGDGDPDVIDYLLLKRYALGAVAVKEDARFRMDLDGDGEIGARDYFLLKKRILAK